MPAKIGDRVVVIEGSSDGHDGVVLKVNPNGWIRIRRGDGVEVDLSMGKYVVVGTKVSETGDGPACT